MLNGKVYIDTEQLTKCFTTEIPRGDVRCSVTGERRFNSTLRVYMHGLRYLTVLSISCYYSIKICRSVYSVQKFMSTCVFNTTVYEYINSRTATHRGYHRDIHITSRAFGTYYADHLHNSQKNYIIIITTTTIIFPRFVLSGRKQANASVRMAWISFGVFACKGVGGTW